LIVADTLRAYQQLAGAHRRRLGALTVVGITGSSGKTSTKEILGSLLRAHLGDAVLVTRGNENTQIGVPQTLLRLTEAHRVAVVELGTSRPGELARLVALARPDVAVLTAVSPAHLEGLGDLAGVAREKASIFDGLPEDGVAVLPAELAEGSIIAARLPGRVIRVQVDYLGGDLTGARFRAEWSGRKGLEVTWPLPGRHLAANAGLALAVADHLGVPEEMLRKGLQACRLPGQRLQIREHDGVTWIADAYNANPDSVRALVAWLAELPPPTGQLHLVLGDMLELGTQAEALHDRVMADVTRRLPAAVVWTLGPLMAARAPIADRAFTEVDELRAALHPALKAGDRVALKGSRAIALERLLPFD
jgi:UDP-N-acetylmuramoyl-tripeptide--D-alanyl-D-alanine ligase